jgi:mutator protein MutT
MRDIVVSAAVIERNDAFLLTRRATDAHLGGRWEFPGGKVEAGETLANTLIREIREELGCGVEVGALLLTSRHAYPDVHVELHFFSAHITDVPVPQQGQEMRWIARSELESLHLPEADAELVSLLISRG